VSEGIEFRTTQEGKDREFRRVPDKSGTTSTIWVDVGHFGNELGTMSVSRGVVEEKRNDEGKWFQRQVALEPMWGEKDMFLRA
jgi:hypothetical protein